MSVIVHGTWLLDEQRFFLWGETDEPTGRRGRQAKQPPHPFQASPDELRAQITDVVPPETTLDTKTLTVWLPSVSGAPLPGSELRAAGVAAPDGEPTLAPWKVNGLLVPVDQALDLLFAPAEKRRESADMRSWWMAALLVMEIIAAQQMLPGLARNGVGLRAVWQLRLVPATAHKVASLARALPPLCRAVVDDPQTAPEPRALLDGFLGVATDALVRSLAASQRTLKAQASGKPTTPGGAWLHALLGADATLPLKGREADELWKAWQEWAGPKDVAGDENFRITFRLEPPAKENTPWALSYLLQANDDPSLLVPTAAIWRERSKMFLYLDRRFDQPQERLLRGLGYAARLFPPIERSLKDKAPDQATFTTEEAFTFLKEAAPLLEQSGFGVLVPSWWSSHGRLKARARATQKGKKSKANDNAGRLTFASMISFRWEMSVGDQPITRAEFERLVALKQPLVQVRGEWIALDPDEMQQALKLFERGGELTMADVLRLGLGGENQQLPGGVAFAGLEAEGELGELLRNLADSQKLETLPQPTGLKGTLRPYQLRGFSWLSFMRRFALGACLADDMGLGKSPQTIALLLHDKAQAPDGGPTLLVCPTSVVGNWQRELSRFAPELRVHTHRGPERLHGDALKRSADEHDVILTSYPLLARDRADLAPIAWRTAVLDEAQNIKNSETQQAKAARSLQAAARVALTGTPVENRLTELWSIMAFLNPGYLGGETEFRRSYARPIERAGDKDAAQRLRRLTAPFILRRLKTDRSIINDLPEKNEMKVYVPLTAEQATLYEATVRDALEQIEDADGEGGVRRRGLVLAMLTKLKQICNHPANFLQDHSSLGGRSGKLVRLHEMLEEVLAENDRALIFTQFAEMGTMLQTYLQQQLYTETLFLHGGTPAKARDAMVRRFQAPEGPSIFILSLKAGGVGLNLTRANHVFHFDRWWNPAVEDQATDRAFRIGQTRNVQVHKFVCGGTLEETIDDMIESKRILASQVLGAGENWLTEFSTDQLRELVALRRDDAEE